MNTPEHSQLGKSSAYADQYDPQLLYPLARQPKRDEIGIRGTLPFLGADLWTAFELGWLNLKGKPQVALARLVIPCDSLNIIESKSLKLYFNSFNNTRLASADALLHQHQRLPPRVGRGGGAAVAPRVGGGDSARRPDARQRGRAVAVARAIRPGARA